MTKEQQVEIDRARRAAKKAAREGGTTHQQALDQAARAAGYRHWGDMLGGTATNEDAPKEGAPVATIASVEAAARTLMSDPKRRSGQRMNDWISGIMRDAAKRALARETTGFSHNIRQLPVDIQMIAQAADPMGGPWPTDAGRLTVRCPCHEEDDASLTISGRGGNLRLSCRAGCLASDVSDKVTSLIAEAAGRAIAFMKDNDRSRVVSGAGLSPEGVGGMGGVYRLADGKIHRMQILELRMLPDGYPVWHDGPLPRKVDTLDRALRTMLAGSHSLTVEPPEDRRNGSWRFIVSGKYGYKVLASLAADGTHGVNAGSGSLENNAAETCATAKETAARVHALLRSFETIDPGEVREIEERHRREVAYIEGVRGTDEDGWGWWAGPDDTEFTYGGPWKTRREAISQGNGSCGEEDTHFYVIQARTSPDEHGEDGMREFTETRGLKRIRAR